MEGIPDLKILTDRYADTTSLERIVRDVVPDASLPAEQRALRLFHWYRRMFFHYRNMGRDRRDALKAINSYGCNLCVSQAAVFAALVRTAGLEARLVAARATGITPSWSYSTTTAGTVSTP